MGEQAVPRQRLDDLDIQRYQQFYEMGFADSMGGHGDRDQFILGGRCR
jgi:hypothetical protein